MGVYKLYTKPVRGQEDLVYIYTYHLPTGQKQPILSSLKLKIPKDSCIYKNESETELKKVSKNLPSSYLLKLGFKSVDLINSFLEEKLEKFIITNGQKDFIPKEKKTFNDWFDIIISRQLNQGTKMRYKNVKNLLEQFQKWYSVNKQKREETKLIYMKNINVDYLNEFNKWLLSVPNEGENRKQNSINSSNFKMKCVKSILNKSHYEDYYSFPINPFDRIKFHFKESPVEILTIDELKKLMNTKFDEVLRRTSLTKSGNNLWGKPIKGGVEERNKKNRRYISKHTLDDIRNYFLFQLLSQGIRVSDLVTLRWSHFTKNSGEWKIKKTMVKTKQEISILVNDKMTSIMGHYIIRYNDFLKVEIPQLEELNKKITNLHLSLNDGFSVVVFPGHKYFKHFEKIKEQLEPVYVQLVGLRVKRESIDLLTKYLTSIKEVNPKPRIVDPRRNQIRLLKEELINWYESEQKELKLKKQSVFIKLKSEKHKIICKMIEKLSTDKDLKDDFVFSLLKKKDFLNIVEDDFSRLDEEQYRKFQSVRTYYNKLLKLVGEQCKIKKRLTSHLSRHSYTTLMVDLGENINVFDVMTSLGHKHLTTTQNYLKRISNKNIDRLNLVISDHLDNGVQFDL
jgi:integrase